MSVSMFDSEREALLDAIVAEGPSWQPEHYGMDEYLADLCLEPCPGLVSALAHLDPAELTPLQLSSYIQTSERAMAWISALQSTAVVALAGARPRVEEFGVDGGVVTIEDAARSEIAAATRWSESWASARMRNARLLESQLPTTRDALRSGEISSRHADIICATVMRLDGYQVWAGGAGSDGFDESCASIEASVLPVARRRGLSATRRAAERALQRVDREGFERRRRNARRSRDVWVEAEPDGMALLMARMGIDQALGCLTAIDGLARDARLQLAPPTTDDAGIGERRAEALAALVLGGGGGEVGQPPVARAHVDVVIDLDTLLGLSDEAATVRATGGPGGPVVTSGSVVRGLIAADPHATLRRLVTDPVTGQLLDRGREVYEVPPALRRYLIARDVTCRFPGCERRADLGQADHAIAWATGGHTSRANLGMLCTRHHQLKTHAGWQITESGIDGSCRWQSPAGLEYVRPAVNHSPSSARATSRAEEQTGSPPSDPDPPPF
jgi:hypothetical protein